MKMFNYYPIYLNLKGKKVLVVGGGDIAERKIKSLLLTKAIIYMVSPCLNKGLKKLINEKQITYINDEFTPLHLKNIFMVICATNKSEINTLVANEANKKKILINIVDSPQKCNFIVPSVVTRGDLNISISTNGNSPALSKRIRRELEERYGKEYSTLLNILKFIRGDIKKTMSPHIRKKKLSEVIEHTEEIIQVIKHMGTDKAQKKIKEIIYE